MHPVNDVLCPSKNQPSWAPAAAYRREQERILAGKPQLQNNSVHHDRFVVASLLRLG
jgi:hypothetical protein